MPTKTWKQWERDVAAWFGSRRNPLSGTNNVKDNGKPRAGDILLEDAIVEVKLRKKHATVERARETARQAAALGYGDNWLQVERIGGDKDIVVLALPQEVVTNVIVPALIMHWSQERFGENPTTIDAALRINKKNED